MHINADDAKQIVVVDLYGNIKLKTTINGSDEIISLQNIHAGTYIVQVINSKAQKIAAATIIKQ